MLYQHPVLYGSYARERLILQSLIPTGQPFVKVDRRVRQCRRHFMCNNHAFCSPQFCHRAPRIFVRICS